MKHKRLSYVDSVKQISVIEVISIRGIGNEEDPIEQITEYFFTDGTRLARVSMEDKPEQIHSYVEEL